jgi:hypothetical protein
VVARTAASVVCMLLTLSPPDTAQLVTVTIG